MWEDTWNNPVPCCPPDGYVGFVYEITNMITGKKYIGKKLYYFSKTKQVKGKKKRYKVESDWKDYYGSNDELLKDVETIGEDKFRRMILHYCKTKGTMSYLELREQMERRVLESDDYYNAWVSARVRTSHIKELR